MLSSSRLNPLQPRKPQRKFYTIHLQKREHPFVFHIRNKNEDPSKSYIVCLQSLQMAEQFIECIRSYYAIHHEWPNTEISAEKPLEIMAPEEAKQLPPSHWATVPKLWIVSWKESELDAYAMKRLFNLFEIKEDGKTFLYTFEYELTDLQTYFENRLGQ